MSAEDPSTETFLTTIEVVQGGVKSPNRFNLFLDYALRISKCKCKEISMDHLSNVRHIPDELTHRRHVEECTVNETGYILRT